MWGYVNRVVDKTMCELRIEPWFYCCRYRPAPEDNASSTESASSPKKNRSSEKSGKSSVKSKKDELWLGMCRYVIIWKH